MLTEYGCQCKKCLERTNTELENARKRWIDGKREIIFKPYNHECSDV